MMIKNPFSEATNRRLCLASALVYVIGGGIGVILWTAVDPQQAAETQALVGADYGLPSDVSMVGIFVNNFAVVVYLFAGALTFGAATLLVLLINGLAHATITLSLATSTSEVVILLGPHGVFELPAFFLAATVAFRVPYEFVRYLARRRPEPLTHEEARGLASLGITAIVLLMVAAWVEVTITPVLADALL